MTTLLGLVGSACVDAGDRGAPTLPAPHSALGGDSELVEIFRAASQDSGVPAELLAAVSFVETRLRMAGAYGEGAHDGHGQSAIGLLALSERGPREVAHAARLSGQAVAEVHTDELASASAAAAVLAELASTTPADLAGWRTALIAYGGIALADEVYARLARGFRGKDASGHVLVVSAPGRVGDVSPTAVLESLGYEGALWNPAHAGNFAAGSRGASDINYVVVHTVQGSYSSAINWFQDPASNVSAHYVVRSSDGEITQMVDDSDVAWHDSCFNSETIGIEHEGYIADPDAWYSETMYLESARLTAWITEQYGIPRDREHIVGHGDAPDCSDHSDPGPGWDWDHYMALVEGGGEASYDAAYVTHSAPRQMVSGQKDVVFFELSNDSNVTWGLDETRLGTAEPRDRASQFFVAGSWLAENRATGADHSSYGPGAVGRFTFAIRAPEVDEPTTFVEHFQLVQEDTQWFGPVVAMSIDVVPTGWNGDRGAAKGDGSDEGVAGGDSEPDGGLTSGCAAGGGSGFSLASCAILVAGVVALRRRRSVRRA